MQIEIKRSDLFETKGYINIAFPYAQAIETLEFENDLNEVLAEILTKKYVGDEDENAQ